MRSSEPRTVFMSIALVGIGSMAGAFLDRLSFPHVAQIFNTCASSRQFVVEFRVVDGPSSQRIPGLIGMPFGHEQATLDVDGQRVGAFGEYLPPLRRFLCEGNHKARIEYSPFADRMETHEVAFAVARPSLFHVTENSSYNSKAPTCVSDNQCHYDLGLELSPYEPDDPKARIYPKD